MKNAFYFILKALFVLKIFKMLPWYFGHVEERFDQKNKVNLVNKQLQYTYYPISQEVKAITQWKLVSW